MTHADVGAQIPALFPLGFNDSTKPTRLLVEQWISIADTVVTLAITRYAGAVPDDDDAAAGLARQYIINWTLAHVMKAIYAGAAPLDVKTAADQFSVPALEILQQLILLGTQAAGDTAPIFNRVLGVDMSLVRDLVISDDDLGDLASPFPGVSRRKLF